MWGEAKLRGGVTIDGLPECKYTGDYARPFASFLLYGFKWFLVFCVLELVFVANYMVSRFFFVDCTALGAHGIQTHIVK